MHELLLYGQVPVTRHEQALKILAGVAAMQPRTFLQRQLIYKPSRPREEAKPNKKYPNKLVKPQHSTYIQLTEELVEHDFGKQRPLAAARDGDSTAQTSYPWIMKTQETPEPETKSLVLRQTDEIEINDELLQNVLDPANNR